MKTTKTLVLVAVIAASAAFATSARAGEGYGWHEGEWNYWDHVDSFCKEHGVKFSEGFFYPGKVQKHFTETWYDWHYKTYMSFDPHSHMPYYFCEGHGVWYPINYIEKVGPGAKGPGPVIGKGGPAPVGGAPVVGAAVGGAPVGGAAVGGAPAAVGGAPVGGGAAAGGAPAGDIPTPVDGAPAGGAAGAPASGAAPAGAATPAKPVSVPTAVVAKNETPVSKEVQKLPDSVFDGAVPEDVK